MEVDENDNISVPIIVVVVLVFDNSGLNRWPYEGEW